jgi:hypothetical protein
MVFRTTGVGLLTLMMRAERTQAGQEPDTEWLLHGPADPDAIEDEDAPLLLAAE